ncbi:hypothetical protein JQC91_01870 [Jannaschia sp. Os4]|uniref:hypothetical protein n=1 Tax=Jannaschia sp. Os4 TaxID=2807617 RepID=UPI001939EB95|nr:hypothetical protein [Jannaschia sp. Os4]MBM2575040.1 hypothetical protein [Jannaschia sp. Os4]
MRRLAALLLIAAAPVAAQERLLAAPPPGWTVSAVAPDPEGGSLAVLLPGDGDGAGRLIVRSLDRDEGAAAYLAALAERLGAACPAGTVLPFGGATGALHLTTCDDPEAVTLSRAIRGDRLHVLSRVWDAPPAEGEVRAWTRWMEAALACGGARTAACPAPMAD